jgi:hypothetical protein
MDQFVKEALEIQSHLNNFNTGKGFKVSKAWNPSTRLLRHSNTQRSEKLQEDIKNNMLQRKTDNRDTRLSDMITD